MPRALLGWIAILPGRTLLAGLYVAFIAAVVLAGLSTTATGQQLPNITSDQLLQLQQQYGQLGQGTPNTSAGSQNAPQSITLQPAVPANFPLATSRLEEILSRRAGAQLKQFGYDQLGHASSVLVPQSGAVEDNYLLGPGDEIFVSLRGQENNEVRATVDRNGQVVLPRLPPISATGRTFGSFRQDVQAAVHRAYVATDASVSVGRIRQISVLVSGEVNNPGQRLVTGLNSVVDALQLSGGVRKTGSLRNIRIQRGGREITVDLYDVLTSQGGALPLRLADGDHIMVPPLGPVVAVSGLVRRPGIYELAPRTTSMSATNLLALAGGQEVRGADRLSLLRTLPDGRTELVPLSDMATQVQDSEILFAQLGADQVSGQVTLSGGSSMAGSYAVTSATKLSDVIGRSGALGNAPYTPFGIIVRKDSLTLTYSLMAFTPVAVLRGNEDLVLQKEDIIRPLSVTEAQLLAFIVHSYLVRLMADQNLIHNPLNQGIVNGTNTVTSALTSQTEAGSAELDDLSSVPSDLQRREITALLDTAAPGSLLAAQRQATSRENQEVAMRESVQPQILTGVAPGYDAQQQMQQQILPGATSGFGAQQQILPSATSGYGEQQQILPGAASGYGAQQQRSPDDTSGYGAPQQISPGAFAGYQESRQARNFVNQPVEPGQFASNQEVETFGQFAEQLGIDPLILVNFLADHRARLDGAVRGPGFYFVGPNIALSDLVQAAGGTANWADESGVELISTIVDSQTGQARSSREKLPLRSGTLSSYIVRPRDQLRFPQVYNDVSMGSVTVQGEVRYPGSYPILRGEHLSDLLLRVGGLSDTAYPYGAIFLRKSAAQIERDGYVRAASDMENQLVTAMTRIGTDKIDPSTFASMQSFVNDLRNQQALGRISVTADPSVLAANAAVDPLLEAGDVIYIPQRPSTVSVLGQVMQSGSYPYKAGRSVEDYIALAGGVSRLADDSSTFIVLPDGSARKIERSWLHFGASEVLPPGSAIVVPRDVTPLDLRQTIIDVSQIMSQFAVSIASVAVLSHQ